MMKNEDLNKIRHSLAHILAAAVQKLYPEAKFGVGPVVDNGFYYDMLLDKSLKSADLVKIQKEMQKIISANIEFTKEQWPINKAIKYFEKNHQKFKVELLNDLKNRGTTAIADVGDDGLVENVDKLTTVTIYKTGNFVDLCRGPHVKNTSELSKNTFELNKLSGAYWRGDENNQQLQRIYGVAFATNKNLVEYLKLIEEAEKRDHRKLGRELDLFTFSDLVGAGLPMYTPRGTVIIESLKSVLNELNQKYDMQQVSIPHLAKMELYETSGHALKFSDELFVVQSHYNRDFVLKPVNCPHHTQIFASKQRSYRELPIRYVEQTMQYRDEKPGEIGGLQRTIGFTVDDGHIFCTIDQIKKEADIIIDIITTFYKSLGLWGNHWVSFSVRDPKTPDKYIGDENDWKQSEKILEEIAIEKNLKFQRMEGEAALYGPKLDFMFKDALGRETQLATIQLDFATPKRFSLTFTNAQGNNETPIMIHRAIFGSFERFLMILIEHFAGAFPVWLAPEQVRVLPVSEKFIKYGKSIYTILKNSTVRVTLDDSNESLGKRIRSAEVQKIPYVLVVGEKEEKTNSVAVRKYSQGDLGSKKVVEFTTIIQKEIKTRII